MIDAPIAEQTGIYTAVKAEVHVFLYRDFPTARKQVDLLGITYCNARDAGNVHLIIEQRNLGI